MSVFTDPPLLAKHFFSLSPATPTLIPSPPFPSPRTLCLPEVQSWITARLIEKGLDVNERDGGDAWRKIFWKRVVKGIEEGFESRKLEGEDIADEEVHPDILEALVKLLSVGDGNLPSICRKRFYWGPISDQDQWKCILTAEDARMISGGTTGLRTWGACIALANHLIREPQQLDCERVLELGSGTGLLSLVAGRICSKGTKIVATDVDDNVLRLLEKNIDLNQLGATVTVAKLDWEEASDPSASPKLVAKESILFNGARPVVILGADIVFDSGLATHLAAMLAFILRYDSRTLPPRALISATIRNPATWGGFLIDCKQVGLEVCPVELQDAGVDGIVGTEGWEGEGEIILVQITLPANQAG